MQVTGSKTRRRRRAGRLTAGPLNFAGVVLLLAVTVMAIFHHHRQEYRSQQAQAEPPPTEAETSFMPLHVGDHWIYESITTDRRSGKVTKQRVQETVTRKESSGFRIIQEVDGKQADSRVVSASPEGFLVLEYESARQPVLFLPPGDLTPGTSWEITAKRRGRVESTETLAVGDEELEAYKIRLERYFDSSETEEPVWLPQGWFWVARGIGVVKRDSAGAKRPRAATGRAPSSSSSDPEIDTLLELKSYQVGSGTQHAAGRKEAPH